MDGQGEGFWDLKIKNETYKLYELDESYKKDGKHYFKLDGQPAESYYRKPNHHAISYTYDEVCYKESN